MSYVYKGCPCICAALRPHMSYYVYKGHPCICAALRLYMSYYVYMGHPFISVQYFPCTFFIISFLYIKHNFFNFIYSIYFHAKTPCECTRRTRGHLSYEKINFFFNSFNMLLCKKSLLMARGKANVIFPMANLTFSILYIEYTSMQKILLMVRSKTEGIFPMDNLTFLNLYTQYKS